MSIQTIWMLNLYKKLLNKIGRLTSTVHDLSHSSG